MADPSQYLTADEIVTYCDMLPVTTAQVIFASVIIDAFVGKVNGMSKFASAQYTEKSVPIGRKGMVKVKHSPIISIDSVSLCVPNSFSYTSAVTIDSNDISFDPDGYIYFPPCPALPITPNNLYGCAPIGINVMYTAGYTEVPSGVKLACAMIAMNIAQQGGFANIQSATNLDARYSLTDPSVFTDDIRRILSEYR